MITKLNLSTDLIDPFDEVAGADVRSSGTGTRQIQTS